MKELVTTVTNKGQVTIQIEVRRLFGIARVPRLPLFWKTPTTRLARASRVVERSTGSLKSQETVKTARQLRQAAEQAIADAVVERG